MSKLVIREKSGHFHLENFGAWCAGIDGRRAFTLVIESRDRGIHLEFPETTLFDLFPRFDLSDPAFQANRYVKFDFLRMRECAGEWRVEVSCGTLHDFFQERREGSVREASLPLSFHWQETARDVA